MQDYIFTPSTYIKIGEKQIASFQSNISNIDLKTVDSFGYEWDNFNSFSNEEINQIGNEYFDIVDFNIINKFSKVLDVGCGSGRWSKYLSDKVNFIEAIDPSNSIFAAIKMLEKVNNVRVTQASVDNIPFSDESFDFVFSLGVLHHIPNTQKAMDSCVKKLKKGGYFLVYLYYDFEDKGFIFKSVFKLVNFTRLLISKLPNKIKKITTDLIAIFIYFPLSRFAKLIKNIFKSNLYKKIFLNYYHDKSFFVMRNDAFDRFGTPLEKRYSKFQINEMMKKSGLHDVKFSEKSPYWHAIGRKIS